MFGLTKSEPKADSFIKYGFTLATASDDSEKSKLMLEATVNATHSAAGFILIYDFEKSGFLISSDYNLEDSLKKDKVFQREDIPLIDELSIQKKFIANASPDDIALFFKENKMPSYTKYLFNIIPLLISNNLIAFIILLAPRDMINKITKLLESEIGLFHWFSLVLEGMINRKAVFFDRITGLYNKDYFIERLKQELERCRRYNLPLSVIFIDICDFHLFNDVCGWKEGDYILREVGKLIKSNVRSVDICARYKADDFAIFMPHTIINGSIQVAKRIMQVIEINPLPEHLKNILEEHVFSRPDYKAKLRVNIGISSFERMDERDISYKNIISTVEDMLNQSKEQGNICWKKIDE